MPQPAPVEYKRSHDAPGIKKRSRWKVRLLLVLTGFAIGTIAAELTLRVLPVRPTPVGYVFDPHTGSRLEPGQRVWQTREGRALVTTNSHGFRDHERSYEKPEGTFRIAVLGDSYAEAVQVEQEETFCSVMQAELQRCLPDHLEQIEVLNFGVSGYGTAQELQLLRHYVWEYDPDMVVLAFFCANDIRNNSRELEPARDRPFFTLQDNQLVLDDSFLENPDRLRFENSSWLQLKDWLVRNLEICALIYDWRHRAERPAEQSPPGLTEPGLSDEIYSEPPPDGAWQDAWEITERLIEQMHQEVSERKIPFLVLSVTTGAVVTPDPELREQFRAELGVDDLLHPDRWIERVGSENGFPVVLLSETMQVQAEETGTWYHGFSNTQLGRGHWNPRGHRLAGERVSETICRLKLLHGGSTRSSEVSPAKFRSGVIGK